MLKLQDFYRFYHFFWREGSSDIKLKLTKKKLRDNKKQVQACISPTIKTDWFVTSTWIFQKFHHIDTFPPGSEETEKKNRIFCSAQNFGDVDLPTVLQHSFFPWQTLYNQCKIRGIQEGWCFVMFYISPSTKTNSTHPLQHAVVWWQPEILRSPVEELVVYPPTFYGVLASIQTGGFEIAGIFLKHQPEGDESWCFLPG